MDNKALQDIKSDIKRALAGLEALLGGLAEPPQALSAETAALLRIKADRWRRHNAADSFAYLTDGFVLLSGTPPEGVLGWTVTLEYYEAPPSMELGDYAVSPKGEIYVARKGTGAPIVWEAERVQL